MWAVASAVFDNDAGSGGCCVQQRVGGEECIEWTLQNFASGPELLLATRTPLAWRQVCRVLLSPIIAQVSWPCAAISKSARLSTQPVNIGAELLGMINTHPPNIESAAIPTAALAVAAEPLQTDNLGSDRI